MVISTRDIIDRYIASYLRRRGLEWSPTKTGDRATANDNSSHTQSEEEQRLLEDVCQTLQDISEELHEFLRQTHKERFGQLAATFLDSFNYESLRIMMDELFAKEITWNHIVTFLVYGAELADRSIERLDRDGSDDPDHDEQDDRRDQLKVSQIVDWMCTYIDSNLLQWIEDQHGGWQSVKSLLRANNCTKSHTSRGMKHYFGAAAFAVFLGGLYLRSKMYV